MSFTVQTKSFWEQANRQLIAKSIGELRYEQILKPQSQNGLDYNLFLKSGVSYKFQAWQSVWEHLRIKPESIERIGADSKDLSAGQFFIDAQAELEMNDITLGHFLEEMQSTLFADIELLKKNKNLTVDELAAWDGLEIQSILSGHPKILLNKGRLGWGAEDLNKYSPESAKPFQLHWLAVKKENLTFSGVYSKVVNESLSDLEQQAFHKLLTDRNLTTDKYEFLPVHPWQFQKVLQLHFVEDFAKEDIISLGLAGDYYSPQVSIRTLSNITHPEKPDIKLPLTILNTSAVRGIPHRYISSASHVAHQLAEVCASDPLLKKSQTEVLQDLAGASYQHKQYSQIKGAPYRYQETLGVVWRQSTVAKLKNDEKFVLTGSLFHQDAYGKSLIGAYIQKSGLSISQWLKAYFNIVIIPLYHLQIVYGLGLVSHGQNIILKLKKFKPEGLFLKDFQGDLRLSSQAPQEIKNIFADHLDQLPPNYLIHDLVTGHFITVLRFISEVLQESDRFSEKEFYQILAETIQEYNTVNKVTAPTQNLLEEKIARVLLNKVRFKIGYADSAERPLPLLGDDLMNPLIFSKYQNNYKNIYLSHLNKGDQK